MDDFPTNEELHKLWSLCQQFVVAQKISCPECVCQSDRVIENAYQFITDVCDVVGYDKSTD